jgi:hypothetical protein
MSFILDINPLQHLYPDVLQLSGLLAGDVKESRNEAVVVKRRRSNEFSTITEEGRSKCRNEKP